MPRIKIQNLKETVVVDGNGAVSATGPTGPQGEQGLPGATGPTGPQGAAGPQGATGPTGAQGLQGSTGPLGPTGPQGVKGDTGSQGPTGAQGSMGPTGATGPTGSTGAGYDGVTSTTSMSISTETKTFTVNKSNTAFSVGSRVRIYASNNFTAYMEGVLTSVSGTSWTVLATEIGTNEGVTFSSWRISLTGVVGSVGATGATGPTGATGAGASDLTAWTSYTPSLRTQTGTVTVGNGSITGAYKLIGKTCFFRLKFLVGSTTNIGANPIVYGLPVEAKSVDYHFSAAMLDSGNAWYMGIANGAYLGLTTEFVVMYKETNGLTWGAQTNTAPFSMLNTDYVTISGSYETV